MTDIIKRNNVHVVGNGTQPMLLAHGFGCDQNMWRFIVPAFEDDYRIVLFDYVGSGKSDLGAYDAGKYSTLGGYADDVLDVVHALDLRDVVFIGHSPRYINDPPYVGGFERSDIEGLLETMEKNYIGWANFLGPVVMQNPDRPELAAELTESFCSTDPVIARRFAEATR